MSDFKQFMRQNKIVKENAKYAPTVSLCDEHGKPLEWEFRPLKTNETELLRDKCKKKVAVVGQKGQYTTEIDMTKYIAEMIAMSVVYPNLNDKELQDSYGVMNAVDLLLAMVDNPSEYTMLADFIQTYNGYSSLNEKVEEAKN